jgi:predicted dehydrogenase
MKKYKVGVIGTGYIGMVHTEILRLITDAEVVAVADSNKELATNAAEKFNIPKVYYNAIDLVNDKEIDVIHNCTPNSLHYDINSKAILAGKEVLSEKPLSMNSKESGELVKLAEKHGTVTGINFCYRYYPVVQEAAARVRKGELGDVRAVIGHFLQDWLFFDTDYSWRLEKAQAGETNVMGDLGSHWCDLVQFITGRKIIEVMSELHSCIPTRKKPKSGPLTFGMAKDTEYDLVENCLDEYASLFIRFDNGARGNFTTCQVAAGKKVDIEVQIFGSKESYSWSHVHPNALSVGHREKANEIFYESSILQDKETCRYAKLPTGHPMGFHDAVYNLFRDYYDAITAKRDGKKFERRIPDFKAGHQEMCVIDAAVKSNKSGSWQKV